MFVLPLLEPIDNTRERKFQPPHPKGKVTEAYFLHTVLLLYWASGDENKQNHQIGDILLLWNKILRTSLERNVW